MVLVVTLALLIFQDYQRGTPFHDPTPSEDPPRVTINEDLVSNDTVATDLTKHGFQVEPLMDTTDSQLVAYEASDTKINGVPAFILAFADRDQARTWAEGMVAFNGIGVIGDTWGISLDSEHNDARSKALAEKIANKIGGRTIWRSAGE